jgi:hypothetical protein
MIYLVTASKHVNSIGAIARQPPISIREGLLEAVFSIGSVPRLYSEDHRQAEAVHHSRVEAGSNTSTVATKMETSDWVYNWATLFLDDINTKTWPSRLGESKI